MEACKLRVITIPVNYHAFRRYVHSCKGWEVITNSLALLLLQFYHLESFIIRSFQGGCRFLQSKFNLAEGSLVFHHSLSWLMDSHLRDIYWWSTFQATGKGMLINLHALLTFWIGTESVSCSAHGLREVGQRTEHSLLREKAEGCTRLETHWCSEYCVKHELTKAIKLYQCLAKWC